MAHSRPYLFGVPQMQLGRAAVRVLLAVRQMDPRRQVQFQIRPDRVEPDLSVVFPAQPGVIASHRQHLYAKTTTEKRLIKKYIQIHVHTLLFPDSVVASG